MRTSAKIAMFGRVSGRRCRVGSFTASPARALAEELSVDAVRAGRSWIAGSTEVELSFTATSGNRSAGIGQRLVPRQEPVDVKADIRGVPGGTVSFHTELGRAHEEPLPDEGPGGVRWRTSATDSAYVRVEVRHRDGGMAGWRRSATR